MKTLHVQLGSVLGFLFRYTVLKLLEALWIWQNWSVWSAECLVQCAGPE